MAFARAVMVDWSAAGTPGPASPAADRCWVGWADRAGGGDTRYCRTRATAEELIRALVDDVSGAVLVGFDFPMGYPAGSGLGGGRALAARYARLFTDGPDDRNDRFTVAARLNAAFGPGPGPFWGCPPASACETLSSRRGIWSFPFPEHRIADGRLLDLGVQSVWKLAYPASVGSQTLMGMGAVHRLLLHLGPRGRLWPFETGWNARPDGVVVAEIWPRLFRHDHIDHPIRDARQVTAAAAAMLTPEAPGWLARPDGLDSAGEAAVLDGEGWIAGLGRGLDTAVREAELRRGSRRRNVRRPRGTPHSG